MTEIEKKDVAPAGDEESAVEMPNFSISRDPSFVRLSPDSGLVVDRGPDLEISLLIHERRPSQMKPEPDSPFTELDGEFSMSVNIVEIGKVRLLPNASVNIAMNILHSNIQAGRVNVEGFRKSIEDMIKSAISVDGDS